MPSRKSSSVPSSPKRKPGARALAPRGAQRAARPRAPRRAEGLTLGAALTIREVGACRTRLQGLLRADARQGTAAIDAYSLHSIDTAGLQLLLVAGQSARQRGRRLAVFGAGDLLQAAAAALGLQGALGAALELHP